MTAMPVRDVELIGEKEKSQNLCLKNSYWILCGEMPWEISLPQMNLHNLTSVSYGLLYLSIIEHSILTCI